MTQILKNERSDDLCGWQESVGAIKAATGVSVVIYWYF